MKHPMMSMQDGQTCQEARRELMSQMAQGGTFDCVRLTGLTNSPCPQIQLQLPLLPPAGREASDAPSQAEVQAAPFPKHPAHKAAAVPCALHDDEPGFEPVGDLLLGIPHGRDLE